MRPTLPGCNELDQSYPGAQVALPVCVAMVMLANWLERSVENVARLLLASMLTEWATRLDMPSSDLNAACDLATPESSTAKPTPEPS